MRQAKTQSLSQDFVSQLRKEILGILKNVEVIAKGSSYLQAETLAKISRAWGKRLDYYGIQIREDLEARIRMNRHQPDARTDATTANWFLSNGNRLWDFIYEVKAPPSIPELKTLWGRPFEEPEKLRETLTKQFAQQSSYEKAVQDVEDLFVRHFPPTRREAEREAISKWLPEAKKWAERTKRKARVAWKYLQDLHTWVKDDPVKITTPIDERVSIEGFQLLFKGFDDAHHADLASLKEALSRYRTLAQSRAPILLQRQLPFVVQWTFAGIQGSTAAASYEVRYIFLSPWVFGKNILNAVRTLAHEMGHHIWRSYLSEKDKTFWSRAINGDYKSLDLRDAVKILKAHGLTTILDDELERIDPILQIQLATLLHDPRYKHSDLFTVENIERYLSSGKEPLVNVPASPISGYSGKNTEEAFCEALGHLVAYGPRRIPNVIRSWLRILLGSGVKISSLQM